jgi:hypothetical protein
VIWLLLIARMDTMFVTARCQPLWTYGAFVFPKAPNRMSRPNSERRDAVRALVLFAHPVETNFGASLLKPAEPRPRSADQKSASLLGADRTDADARAGC